MQQSQNKIPVYFVPGLAASTSIFEYINLPSSQYEVFSIPWLMPKNEREAIEDYALRMTAQIQHENPVLVGVSFGGVMVQEMSKHIPTRKVIIISSVKSRDELPKRLKVIQKSNAYKLFPAKALKNIEDFAQYAFGNTIKKKMDMYQKYLSVREESYLRWAIYTVLHWQQKTPNATVAHIHGDDDHVFPIKHIKNCHVIKGGTHAMILNKSKKISTLLNDICTHEH